MIGVLIFAVDAKLRRTLEQLPKRDTDIRIVGIADDQQSFVRLADKPFVDVVLAQEMPTDEQFASLRVRHKDAIWVLFLASETERAILEALSASASAVDWLLLRHPMPRQDCHFRQVGTVGPHG